MFLRFVSMLCGALLLPGAFVATAHAQDRGGDQRQDSVVRLPSLEVRGILALDIAATPGAAATLTAASIRQFRPLTLHDAFDHVAGVRTIDDDILGRRSAIGIRGAPSRRSRKTLLLEDGVPINSSTYLDPAAHYTPPLERLERVEVLKGAGQIVHGPLNNHGIVNFRNRRPTAAPHTVAELGVGSHAAFRRHLLHSRSFGALGVLGAYTGMNADGTFDTERHRYDDLFGSVAWRASPRHTVAGSLTFFRERFDGYDEANLTPQQFALHPRSKLVLDEGREFNNFAINYFKVDVAHDGTAGGAALTTRLFTTRLDRPRFATRGAPPGRGGVMEGRDRLYRTFGGETRAALPGIRLGGVLHTLQAGLRHERHFFDYARPVGRPGEALDHRRRGNVYAAAGVDGYTRDGRLMLFEADASSLFVENLITRGRWLVTPGVRVERFTQRRDVAYWPGNTAEGARLADSHTLVLPGVSLLHHATAGTQLYAGVHRGYAPATARTEEFPLLPETGVNTQFGVRSATASGHRLDVAVFYNRISNTLIRDDVDVFGEALFVNTADSDVYGADVVARVQSGSFGGSAAAAFAEVAFNHTRAQFAGGPLAGNRVPEVPRNSGSATAGLDAGERWGISATVSHFGAFFADKENTRELRTDGGLVPRRTLLAARATWQPRAVPGAGLWVQGRNLADALYVSDVQDGLRPGAPRTLIGGVTLSF